ncbi:unnamed protein product [Cylicocyclus nassatus]|uniref:Uncharacterized protein n=1 Tax=Cylicocyclus nassatus TaxID=53992 RepID=A0AA36DVH1_CYLNA|nr:unnamed protein product [Cylicocyclus nassatus]
MGENVPTSKINGQESVAGTAGGFAPITKKEEDHKGLLRRTKTASPATLLGADKTKEEGHDKKKRQKAKGDAPKRRAVVYHDEGPGNRFSGDYGHRASSSTDEYRKGSTSDEYKRRLYDMREKYMEEKANDEGESQNLYKILAVVLSLVILVLLFILYFYFLQPQFPSMETLRYQFGVMTEVFDCSLHMKRRFIQGDTVHDVVRQGLMCLYALAPHTIHEESSLQMIFAHIHTYEGKLASAQKLELNDTCVRWETPCRLGEVWNLFSGYGYSAGKLADSLLSSVWLEPKKVDTDYHAAIWSRSLWDNVTYGYGSGKMKPRKFRLHHLLLRIAKQTRRFKKLLSNWQKRFPNINISTMSTRDTITITEDEANLAASIFASNRAKKSPLRKDRIVHVPLTSDEDIKYSLELIYSKSTEAPTLSFMAAFLIKVVYTAFLKVQPEEKVDTIALMTLNAQRIALQMLRRTRHWTGNPKDPYLMNLCNLAVDQIIKQTYDKSPIGVRRNATNERVSSILMWIANKHVNSALIMEMSLPHVFDPTGGGTKRLEYSSFVDKDGARSPPFLPSAGIVVVSNFHNKSRPIIAATASGRERLVEGVANTVLRLLLINEGAGMAVKPIDAYLDASDGLTHCSEELYNRLKKWFNFACDTTVITRPERRVMAFEAVKNAPYATMAMSQEYGYAYAPGF